MLAESEFIVLNAVYLKKMADAAQIAATTGLAPAEVASVLAAASEKGWLLDTGSAGTMLLEEGIGQVVAHYRDAYAAQRSDPALSAWYENFEALNARFIAAVSDWQKNEEDERSERRVLQAAERLAKDIGQLVPRIARYAAYPRRLERSMERIDAGAREFVCKPTVDSVHNIWFEFHEDILAVLGRPRETT